jgi:hypothetical protein
MSDTSRMKSRTGERWILYAKPMCYVRSEVDAQKHEEILYWWQCCFAGGLIGRLNIEPFALQFWLSPSGRYLAFLEARRRPTYQSETHIWGQGLRHWQRKGHHRSFTCSVWVLPADHSRLCAGSLGRTMIGTNSVQGSGKSSPGTQDETHERERKCHVATVDQDVSPGPALEERDHRNPQSDPSKSGQKARGSAPRRRGFWG